MAAPAPSLLALWIATQPEWVTRLLESAYRPRTKDLLSREGRAVSTYYLPRRIGGMLRALTGFRQGPRISGALPCYRHAPWGKVARSLAPPDGLSIYLCSSSSAARTASPRASWRRGSARRAPAWPISSRCSRTAGSSRPPQRATAGDWT